MNIRTELGLGSVAKQISRGAGKQMRVASVLRPVSLSVVYLFLLASLLVGFNCEAQTITGDIVGTVTDATGAVIPAATVTVTNQGTQAKRTLKTGSSGEFDFQLLPAGTYDAEVSAVSFKKFVTTGLTLSSGDRLRSDVTLQTGAASETVSVSASVTGIQTDSATVVSTINEKATEDIPLQGRNFVNLVTVQTGVNAGTPTNVTNGGRPDDRRASGSISANGQLETANNNLIDGLDNLDRIEGFIVVRPSIDAISEIKINTNLYDAQYGRTSGAVVNILTKSGSNAFHGTAYEFFRNDITDAKNFFAGALKKPELRQNQFGGSLGGRIFRDKTFFFADYEGLRKIDASNSVYTNTVPTLFEQNNPGNFSDVIDSATGLPGPVLTSAQLNATGLGYFKLFPHPNQTGVVDSATGATSLNFAYAPALRQNANTFDVRADHSFNSSNQMFVRYSYSDTKTIIPPEFPAVNGVQAGGTYGDQFPGTGETFSQNAAIDYTHIFSPTLVAEVRGGYTNLKIDALPINYGRNLNDQAPYLIPNANGGTDNSGLAPLTASGYGTIGDAVYEPGHTRDNVYQANTLISYTRNNQTFRLGGGVIRRTGSNTSQPYGKGFFFFAIGANPLENLEAMIQGTPVIYLRQNQLVPVQPNVWEPSIFFQDDWHASKRLTLNLGIRYDIFTALKNTAGGYANFNLQTAKLDVNPTGDVSTRYSNVAPRVGFAFSATPKTVIRGGFGLSFFPTDTLNSVVMANPPNTYISGVQYIGLFSPGTISDGIALPVASSTTNLSGGLTNKTPNYHAGYMEQFNLTFQQQLGSYLATVSYVGNNGRHLSVQIPDVNQPAPVACPVATVACTEPARPFATSQPNVTTIVSFQDGGSSSYNSLQTTFERRFTSGLTLNANYTWAHGIDDALDPSTDNGSGVGLLPAHYNTYDRGNSTVDVRNRFALTGNYDLPFGRGKTGFLGVAEKGWQVNALAFWQTGTPFTVLDAAATINLPGITTDRPNVTGNPKGSGALDEFFNTAAYSSQPYGTAGNSGRNTLYGPHSRRGDVSLFKTTPIRENLKFQFRVEVFNISNTPNFLAPASTLHSSGFGVISQTNPTINARQVQFAGKFIF